MKSIRFDTILCPVAQAKADAMIFGVRNPGGDAIRLKRTALVDQSFLDDLKDNAAPEALYMFADTCSQAGCDQWSKGRCRLIERIIDIVPVSSRAHSVEVCAISSSCRWRAQAGDAACRACVVALASEPDPDAPIRVAFHHAFI